jgi:hypothetical protein
MSCVRSSRWRRPLLYFWGVYVLTPVVVADDYLESRLVEIEQTLFREPPPYGVDVVDDVTMREPPSMERLGPWRKGFSVFVKGGDVLYSKMDFSSVESNEPKTDYTLLFRQSESVGKAARKTRSQVTLEESIARGYLVFGEVDVLGYDASGGDDKSIARSPFQAISNPCFAHLELSPMQLRSMDTNHAVIANGCIEYDFVGRKHERPINLVLTFSPEHGDALTMSVLTSVNDSKLGFSVRETREVTAWQQISDGVFVPQQFTYLKEVGTKRAVELNRTYREVAVGSLPADQFEEATIPQFQQQFAERVDSSKQPRLTPAGDLPGRGSSWSSSRVVLIVLNIIFVSLIVLWAARRRSS